MLVWLAYQTKKGQSLIKSWFGLMVYIRKHSKDRRSTERHPVFSGHWYHITSLDGFQQRLALSLSYFFYKSLIC